MAGLATDGIWVMGGVVSLLVYPFSSRCSKQLWANAVVFIPNTQEMDYRVHLWLHSETCSLFTNASLWVVVQYTVAFGAFGLQNFGDVPEPETSGPRP